MRASQAKVKTQVPQPISEKSRQRAPPLTPDRVEKVRSKMKAAAYTGTSGRQLEVVFARFDKGRSGHLEDEEVRRALRGTLRIPPSMISDAEISSLCALLDADNLGTVAVKELVTFVGPEPSS